ncbi:hypothetical protein CMV_023109 [Castanea mollissima]|uniref:non-specific serine/threonine protein kinase n=1 Tax=Castanea mollissima TaxID=60419 RepID=A0A8J4QGM7_9ROSI|nr:hypothetical protein CMV_023109 [Castanea mollissima]
MRLGLNPITGLDRFLKSQDDPGTGDYFYKMNPTGSPQFVLYKGSTLYWRTGPWPWPLSSSAATSFKYSFVNNKDEVSYAYFFDDTYIITRLVLHNYGLLQHLMWNDGDLQWKEFWSPSKYRCDNYRHCGAYGKCGLESGDRFNKFECTCLPGYEPKSPRNWYHRDGSEGCVRKQSGLSMCGNGEGFVKVELLKAPDSFNAVWMDMSMSSSECEQACLRNCSCIAFVSMNIDGKGTSCLAWYGELIDVSENLNERWDLNVRVDAIELATYTRKSNGFLGHKRQRAITIISLMVTLFLVCLIGYICLMKKKRRKTFPSKKEEENKRTVKRKLHNQSLYFTGAMDYLEGNELEENSRHPDLLIFDLSCIVAATNNFSPINKLGEGGFGSVFKGQLSNGQQVAVKRLSNILAVEAMAAAGLPREVASGPVDEISYFSSLDDRSIITRFVVDSSGHFQQLTRNDGDCQWKEVWSTPRLCDNYGNCGAYSICIVDSTNRFTCTCLPGHEPKSLRDGSEGCVRKKLGLSMCGNGEGFVKVAHLKTPDTFHAAWKDMSMSSLECEQACLRNCSCTAFINYNPNGKGFGCLSFYGELIDILEFTDDGWDLNVRVDATELAKYTRKSKGFLGKKRKLAVTILSVAVPLFLASLLAYIWLMKKRKTKATYTRKSNGFLGHKRLLSITIISVMVTLFMVCLIAYICLMKKRKTKVKRKLHNQSLYFTGTKGYLEGSELEESSRHPDLLIFDLSCIVAATDNFSPINKLGQGGFGSVFKGQLSNGQEVAIKRLSYSSTQGIEEFKNEVLLIAKLQHRNLVKLFGCCIQGEEKMLIYEYMPNKSLDFFIFDHTRSSLLNWGKRFEIIIGIARGILYLHQDSRLKIIHRDLKTSNVLLDGEMNPKISDFGIARIFNGDQIQDTTTRVVGTYGYMSPEYAIFGKFSTKSDVFSFGVILLEIVSGKKNNSSYQRHDSLTLIGHVWELWREDRVLDIVDSSINDSFVSHEVLRCIQIGLLCVQEDAMDRPTMLAVLLMLSCETTLPSPKQPAFIFRRPTNNLGSITGEQFYSINDVTITKFEAR